MGAVENLAVAQLPLHVAHDALPQGRHLGQVVRECRVHDAKDALPAFSGHESSCAPFATLASHACASSYMVLLPAQVDQSYPPVGHQADADPSSQLIVDDHLRLMLLSGYIVEGDALDPREEDLHVGEARVIGHTLRRVHNPDAHPTHDLSQGGALREWIVPRTRTYVVFKLLDLDGTDERRRHERLLAACAPDHEHLPSSLRHG